MKQVYPIVITPDEGMYVVYIPDFDINTEGMSVSDAISMARDAIGMAGCYLQDEKRSLPSSSALNTVQRTDKDLVTLVDIDFAAYRKKHDMRTVRKNVTLPSWLNEEAENAHINFSALLQKALKEELRITDH